MSEKVETTPISWKLENWFPELTSEQLNQLKTIHDQLLKFNKTINLVSAKTIGFSDVIHFSDSILASQIIRQDIKTKFDHVFDLGSGNGFPGLVFAALYKDIRVSLVDSDQRKCEYLKACASAARLSNIQVINSNIESLPPSSIQYAMARGLANISKTILMTRKCIALHGVLYHLKSEQWGLEVGEIPTQLCSVWSPALVQEYKLPAGPVKFAIIKTERIS